MASPPTTRSFQRSYLSVLLDILDEQPDAAWTSRELWEALSAKRSTTAIPKSLTDYSSRKFEDILSSLVDLDALERLSATHWRALKNRRPSISALQPPIDHRMGTASLGSDLRSPRTSSIRSVGSASPPANSAGGRGGGDDPPGGGNGGANGDEGDGLREVLAHKVLFAYDEVDFDAALDRALQRFPNNR